VPTTIAPAVNLQAGVTTAVAPPSYADIGNNVVACVIFNYSSSVIAVTGSFGQRFLAPLTADVFPCPTIQSAPYVAPTTIAAANTFVGTAQAVFYFKGDDAPGTYPQSLVAFPGGNSSVAGAIPFGLGVVDTVLPPSGTGTLTVVATRNSNNSTSGTTSLTVTGAQSGTTYLATTQITPWSLTAVNLVTSIDTSYIFTWSITGGGNALIGQVNVTASPSTPVPTFATLTAQAVSTTSSLIATPATGAWYIFGADLVVSPQANAFWTVGDATRTVFELETGPATTADHIDLPPYRTTTAINVVNNLGGGRITIRYAPGP
jgi:hypothetical protein